MKEEYLEIEEVDFNTQHDAQQLPNRESSECNNQLEFLPIQPSDFDGDCDDVMLKKLLKKFQMCFLYPFLKACDITYRSLRYLSVEDINTTIRSVGHRAEFREKLFNWRRKRYRTNDLVIEHEKTPSSGIPYEQPTEATPNLTLNTNIKSTELNQTNSLPPDSAQTVMRISEKISTSSPNTFKNIINPLKRESNSLDNSLLEIMHEVPADTEYEVKPSKRSKKTTVELRETRLSVQLNLSEVLDDTLLGPVLKSFYDKHGYLEQKHRDELIQSIVDYVIKREIKLHSCDFNKIVEMIIRIFPNEEESRDYYFINRKGKRNPMGRLFTKYYNTLKRLRVRNIHQEFNQELTLTGNTALQEEATTSESITQMSSLNTTTTSTATLGRGNNRNISMRNIDGNSNNSNSNNTQIAIDDDEFQELIQFDDTTVSAIKNFLRCPGLDWDDVKTMWTKTYLVRQEDIEHSTIKDLLQQWPKYLNARGMELFDIDFRLKFSRNKANALHKQWQKFVQKICSYYQSNIKDDMCKGLFTLFKSKPGKDTEDYIITVLLNAIMLPMGRYRDAVGSQRKISIVEAIDLFAIRVNTLEDLDQKREEFSIKYGDIHNDNAPLVVVVGDANINIHEIYVHFDVALYEMPDFISALDCCMKIYRVLNFPYPVSSEYLWTFMQRYFYEITLPDDMKSPAMSSLITYLKF